MPLFKKKSNLDVFDENRDITDDVIESDFVPYACHWDKNTILTKNGETLQIIKISCGLGESPLPEDGADLRSKIRDAVVASIPFPEYACWIHTVRRKMSFQAGGEFKRDFAGYLDRFWRDRNDWEHQFFNEIYISVVLEGEGASLLDLVGFVRRVIPKIDARARERVIDESARKLSAVVDKLARILAPFGARRLTVVPRGNEYYSEQCSFLAKLVSFIDHEMPVPQMSIADYITDYDVTFGFNAMEVRARVGGKRKFGACLTIKDYRELPIEPLESFLQMPCEFILGQSFTFIEAKEALKGVEYQKKLFDTGNAALLLERTGLQSVIESKTGKPVDFCKHQICILLTGESIKTMESGVSKMVSVLGTLGLAPMREDIALEECYWANLPGNFQFIKRTRPINTKRVGGFANLNLVSTGLREGNHWGPAVTTLYTLGRTPYFFNFHTGDNGHTLLVGPTEAGKTTIMNFLLSGSRKFDGKLFYFGKDRQSEIFIRSVDGVYYNPYPGADPRPYTHISMNPLQLDDTQPNRDFLRRWLLLMVSEGGDPALPDACDKVIAQIMQKPKGERRLSDCIDALAMQNPAWGAFFTRWVGQGEYASVFSNANDSLTFESKVVGFDMGELLRHKGAFPAVFAYLLHRVMQALDGRPATIVLDEAWDFMEMPPLSLQMKHWLAALRTKNAMALLTTEHIDDIMKSATIPELLPLMATTIFLPDEAADAAYSDVFGLSAADVTILSEMDTDERHFLVKRGDLSVALGVDLSGMSDIAAVLSAAPFHLGIMEQAIAARGISPSQWMPKFLESI